MALSKKSTMPVVLVNPAHGRKPARSNPRRKKRRSSKRRRRNPARSGGGGGKMTFGKAAMAVAIGAPMGAVAHGVSWGVDKAETLGPGARAAIKGGVGLLGALGLAYLDVRAAAGLAGGTGAVLTRDLVDLAQMSDVAKDEKANGTNGDTTDTATEASAVYRLNAGRRTAREAAAVYRTGEAGAVRSLPMPSAATRTLKAESGTSRYVPQPPPFRFFGPQSWAYRTDAAGRRIVSAHNR